MGINQSSENTVININKAVNKTITKSFQTNTNKFVIKQYLNIDCTDAIKDYNNRRTECVDKYLKQNKKVSDLETLCKFVEPECVGEDITIKNYIVVDKTITQEASVTSSIETDIKNNLKSNLSRETGILQFNSSTDNTIKNITEILNKVVMEIKNKYDSEEEISQTLNIGTGTLKGVTIDTFKNITEKVLQSNKTYTRAVAKLAVDISVSSSSAMFTPGTITFISIILIALVGLAVFRKNAVPILGIITLFFLASTVSLLIIFVIKKKSTTSVYFRRSILTTSLLLASIMALVIASVKDSDGGGGGGDNSKDSDNNKSPVIVLPYRDPMLDRPTIS